MDFIKKESTSLVVIDMQDRLMNAIPQENRDSTTDNAVTMIEAAKILNIPIIVTEQYPKGLGPTVESIREAVGDQFEPIEKVVFSCARSPEFETKLDQSNRKEVIIVGVETHVCVLQTSMDLINKGYTVYVPADAVTSRRELDWQRGISLIEKSGAFVGTKETFLFQLLERAGTDEFKQVAKLVK